MPLKLPTRPVATSTTNEPPAPSTFDKVVRGQPVGDSEDLRRILKIPRRDPPGDAQLKALADEFKESLGLHNPQCECRSKFNRPCCSNLKPVQAWALYEAATVGGILGPIGVGHGKTLLDMLVPMVAYEMFQAKVALLLLPSNLKKQFLEVDWGYYGQHWKLPNIAGGRWMVPGRPLLHVVAFSELSGSKSTDLLHRIRPDVIVVDEAHSLRNRTAARTKRFLSYCKANKKRLFCWSGTLTSRSIRDYAHLSDFSLGEGSPVPRAWHTLEEWASAIDPSDFPSPPGRLSGLLRPDETLRSGYRRRLVESPGVISSGDVASCQATLQISERKVEAPKVVFDHLQNLEATWQRPDGEELVDALSKARCARELSCGFFYRWRWPRGEPVAVIENWLKVRKDWHKELRERLKKPSVHMDSPLLLTKAAIRWEEGYWHVKKSEDGTVVERTRVEPRTKNGPLPTWESEFWTQWREVRDTAKPETEAVWFSDFLVADCVEWLSVEPGILWYEFDGLARKIRQAANDRGVVLAVAGPGREGDDKVLSLTGGEAVLASIRAHGTGKNLQQFHRNLVANPPSDGTTWEQLMGRTHRQGQESDLVSVEVYRHTEAVRNAVEKARDLSEYIEGTWGASQRLASIASWGF